MKTIGEFKSLFDLLQAFPTEESCIEYLEKKLWKDGIPVSPYDPSKQRPYFSTDLQFSNKPSGTEVSALQ